MGYYFNPANTVFSLDGTCLTTTLLKGLLTYLIQIKLAVNQINFDGKNYCEFKLKFNKINPISKTKLRSNINCYIFDPKHVIVVNLDDKVFQKQIANAKNVRLSIVQ